MDENCGAGTLATPPLASVRYSVLPASTRPRSLQRSLSQNRRLRTWHSLVRVDGDGVKRHSCLRDVTVQRPDV